MLIVRFCGNRGQALETFLKLCIAVINCRKFACTKCDDDDDDDDDRIGL